MAQTNRYQHPTYQAQQPIISSANEVNFLFLFFLLKQLNLKM